jgi:FkbM family methyltransferase
MKIKYIIGLLIKSLGYNLRPDWKSNQGNLHPIDLAASLIRYSNNGKINSVLQIGVYDGIQNDPLIDRILNNAMRVILVEPQPFSVKTLKERYNNDPRFLIIEAAVSDKSGKMTLYGDSHVTPRASLNKDHCKKFGIKNPIEIGKVRTITPNELISEIGGECPTILQIDTEGYDWKILKIFFSQGHFPLVVNFENFHLSKTERIESRSLMSKYGYSFIEYGFDTCAISSKFNL